ncbi:tRNA pseudouridine(38-40) synthase TruA [Bartonella sp. DGB1]|uniref:tRNA pseudouridine(38-40) synthase TruA n=1 Tax=Bartonella sp. DGB1 TaxID=3239807 RepID=UPI003524DF7F
MRYKILIEYEGSNYVGWQRQKDHHSVQEAIETAIFAFSGENVTIVGAGRTDAGVHALSQVAHFDLNKKITEYKLMSAINGYLKLNRENIIVTDAQLCADDFNARFSAVKRHYMYKVYNRNIPAVLDKNRCWWVPNKLDIQSMVAASKKLVGLHDFTTFRSVNCQAKNPVRHLDQCDIIVNGYFIEFYLSAKGFLHNQVRSIVGSLIEVGIGRWSVDDLEQALKACDRTKCGRVAPPYGLYFVAVDY